VKALDINNIRIKNIVNKIIHKNKQKEISLIKIIKNINIKIYHHQGTSELEGVTVVLW
tara:strand:- start:16 stop:189 length:174 start_codon:yes stop_codon:yes gene_type:complete